MKNLSVKDIIRQTFFIDPNTTLNEAAEKMEEANCAILPIGTPTDMLGIITNRDLVIQSLINGKHDKLVKDYMKQEVTFCKENTKLKDVIKLMERHNTNFVFVQNSDNRVIGKISFEELLKHGAINKDINKIVQRVTGAKAA